MRSGALPVMVGLMLCVPALAQPTNPQDDGQLLFNNACRTCHSIKDGDNRLGPSLHGVVGRKAGSLPGYAYSDTMKGAGIVWDEATLDRFIADPETVVRGNKMKPYGGIASADERSRLIAYLKSADSR
jgi:cytochrome c